MPPSATPFPAGNLPLRNSEEPLENAAHVRNAIARFNQVEGVTDEERDAAWKHIHAVAKKH